MKKVKIIVFLFVMLLGVYFICNNNVYASEKKYEVKEALFDVELQENGDAYVTETWTINFISGNFTRYYKDIYHDLDEEEKFSDIEFIDANINGHNLRRIYDDNKMEYSYFIEDINDSYRINFYKSVSDEQVVYSIKYLLKDIVKKTEDDNAIFSYRFVGRNYNDNIKKIKTTIKLPDVGNIKLISSSAKTTYYIYDDNIVLETANKSGLILYKIKMPSDIFGNIKALKVLSKSEKIILVIKVISALIVFLSFFIIPLVLLIRSVKKADKLKKFVIENPIEIENFIKSYELKNIHPIELANMLNKSEPILYIAASLLHMVKNEKCLLEETRIKIDGDLDYYDKELLNILISKINNTYDNNYYVFEVEDLVNAFSDTDLYNELMNEIDKIKIDSKDNSIISSLDKQKIQIYYSHNIEFENIRIFDLFELALEDFNNIDYIKTLSVYFISRKKQDEVEIIIPLLVFANFFDMYIYQRNYSSVGAGCSACSSCSSCGGCGGGGAD